MAHRHQDRMRLFKWSVPDSSVNEDNLIKNCLNNTELRNDHYGWARREALNVLGELHQQRRLIEISKERPV